MFKTSLLPLKSVSETVDKSFLTNVKSDALEPTKGKVPVVFIGFPFNFICAILLLFLRISKVMNLFEI